MSRGEPKRARWNPHDRDIKRNWLRDIVFTLHKTTQLIRAGPFWFASAQIRKYLINIIMSHSVVFSKYAHFSKYARWPFQIYRDRIIISKSDIEIGHIGYIKNEHIWQKQHFKSALLYYIVLFSQNVPVFSKYAHRPF